MTIYNFLGHRVPFIFLDEFISQGPGEAKGKVEFGPHKYRFFFNGKIDFCDLMEALAQLSAGDIVTHDLSPKAGYFARINFIRNLCSEKNMPGQAFRLESSQIDKVENYYTYSGKVWNGNTPVLESEFSIMCVEDESLKNLKTEADLSSLRDNFNTFQFDSDIYNSLAVIRAEDRLREVRFSFRSDAEFLKGHFVNQPVVPGIYLMRTAMIVASQLIYRTEDYEYVLPREVTSVKFMDIVRPEEILILQVKSSEDGSYVNASLTNEEGKRKAMLKIIY